jgi:hypothetical protein
LGRASDFPGLEATGLDSDLIPQTPILNNAVEVAPEVVAKALERLGQDDTSVDDLDYCDSEQD